MIELNIILGKRFNVIRRSRQWQTVNSDEDEVDESDAHSQKGSKEASSSRSEKSSSDRSVRLSMNPTYM